MSGLNFFGFNITSTSSSTDIPEIFPMQVSLNDFVSTDVMSIYEKILTDVFERTQGLKDEHLALLFDNCLESEASEGLIQVLAKAMRDKSDLFLVYEKALNLLRKANSQETAQIREDYKSRGESLVGTYISFKNYKRSDMVKLYSTLEYNTISALSKQSNLSKAIQLKIKGVRGGVALSDSEVAKKQAQDIAEGLGKGKDVMLDSEDTIETAVTNIEPVEKSIAFLNQKRSFYLGLPSAYIAGILQRGLGDTGEGDQKAIERGLKNYFFSIVRPVLQSLFDIKAKYKTQDFRQLTQALEAMKSFELVGEEYLTKENKKQIVESLLDIDPEDNKTTFDKSGPVPEPSL